MNKLFRQIFNMFKDLSLESRIIQTQNCAPIQCIVWPRNVTFSCYYCSIDVNRRSKHSRLRPDTSSFAYFECGSAQSVLKRKFCEVVAKP